MLTSITIHTETADETRRVGKAIGEMAAPGDVYLLTGPLGAGKTCLTQGIASGLRAPGYARSPTFVLVTRYQGRLTIHHADLYRIDHPAEAWDLGLEDIIAAGEDVLIVEWADRAAEIFPQDALWIGLDYAPDGNPAACEVIPGEDGSVPSRHRISIVDAPDRYAPLLEQLTRYSASHEPGPAR
ncbi:MAG: tRNA (adenosine(37)-N6)-threonylcarbamoyltransferase complex ATPase subunit type 1 TsaE [Chloroflexota bacterium]|nr:tRNA (adenosine(37)-N6)-threonylcarbamoyltransferase complex ATPase subunit type 1 TsaE [Chloroflexota bacterium]